LDGGQNQMKMLKKGELIEPLKPIVYYIDPLEKWKNSSKVLMIGKSPLKQLDGKMLSVENIGQNDPTMSLEDARFCIEIFCS
jgi:hypothetical protein